MELKEKLDELNEVVGDFLRWAQDEYAYTPVVITQHKEFDLGEFGYREIEIEVEEDEYSINTGSLIDSQSDTTVGEMMRLLEGVMEAAESEVGQPPSLKEQIAAMLASPSTAEEGRLAVALSAVLALHEHSGGPTSLPPVPLPWPGALREDIDYTADDFPLRFQPPPGFDWATDVGDRVHYRDAVAKSAPAIGNSGMILDYKGRVSWMKRHDDPLDSGGRWYVWHMEREGIPEGRAFNVDSPPRALDRDGHIIAEPSTSGTGYDAYLYNWDNDGVIAAQAEKAITRLASLSEIAEAASVPNNGATLQFEPPAPVGA